MNDITNINDIGTKYNIVSKDGTLIKNFRVITQDEILTSTIGEFDFEFYGENFKGYIESAQAFLSGFPLDPCKVAWRTIGIADDESRILELIDECIADGYDYMVLETLLNFSNENVDMQ